MKLLYKKNICWVLCLLVILVGAVAFFIIIKQTQLEKLDSDYTNKDILTLNKLGDVEIIYFWHPTDFEKNHKLLGISFDEYTVHKEILQEFLSKKNYTEFDKVKEEDVPLDVDNVEMALYDINGDNKKEILFNLTSNGYCYSSRCRFSILKQKDSGEWEQIFMPNTPPSFVFILNNEKNLGYKDFIFADKWEGWNIWKWDGEKYIFYKKHF